MPKVVFVADWWNPDFVGGAERTIYAAALLLVSEGFEVHVVTLRNPDTQCGPTNQITSGDRIIVTYLPSATLRSAHNKSIAVKLYERIRLTCDWRTRARLVAALLREKPDVIVYGPVDRFGPRALRYASQHVDVPSVRSYHDFSDACITRSRFKNGKNCRNTCFSCEFRTRTYVKTAWKHQARIYVSDFVRKKFVKFGHPDESNYVGYPGLEGKDSGENTPLSNRLTDSSIGYVGRIHHTKGIDLLIRAASIEPKLSVVAIGHGEEGYVGELNNLARTLQVDFTLLPYSQTPYQDLQGRVRVVAVPSLWEEAFGRIPIEAANFGLPCVIANIGGLPEAGALVSPLSLTFVPGDYFDLRRAIDATPVGIVVRRSESNRAFPNVLFARVLAAIDD